MKSRTQRRPATERWLVLVSMALLAMALAPLGAAVGQEFGDRFEWTNPLLGPRYAQWLVGPISQIATAEERQAFLALENDQEAAAFIERFWSERRSPLRAIYERRAEEADRRYSEGAYPGRKTDRGALYVLYGDPATVEYEEFRNVEEPDVELWRYAKDAEVGLDGNKPRRLYRFAKDGDLTRMFRKGGPNDPAVKRRRSPGYRGPSRLPPF